MSSRAVQNSHYKVLVDNEDTKCLTLMGKECWPGEFVSDDKSIAEIIVNAANYAANNDDYYFTPMDRVLCDDPVHPNPNLSR